MITPNRFNYLRTLFDLIEQERHLNQHRHAMSNEEKQPKANEIIKNHVGFALGAALVPFPGADLLAVSGVQLNMLRQLAKLYNVGFMDKLGRNVISAVAGGGAARLGASLVKAIPGVGTIIGDISMAALSGGSTYALGRVVANHFAKGGTMDNLDFGMAKKQYEVEIEEGKKVATDLVKEVKTDTKTAENLTTDEIIIKLRKMAEMRDEGLISVEEFQKLKEKLLAEM